MNALILLTDVVEKFVLLGLVGLSIWSIAIILDRAFALKKEVFDFEQIRQWVEARNWKDMQLQFQKQPCFMLGALLVTSKNQSSQPEAIEKTFQSFVKKEKLKLEKGLGVLATLGANAPFVGLFGTVLGIIRSFAYIGAQSGSQAVMSGVSQALYATAMGLFVAIPAVTAYNIFSRKIRELTVQAESLRDLYLSSM